MDLLNIQRDITMDTAINEQLSLNQRFVNAGITTFRTNIKGRLANTNIVFLEHKGNLMKRPTLPAKTDDYNEVLNHIGETLGTSF